MHIPQVAYDAARDAFLERPDMPLDERLEVAIDVALEVAKEDAEIRSQQCRHGYLPR